MMGFKHTVTMRRFNFEAWCSYSEGIRIVKYQIVIRVQSIGQEKKKNAFRGIKGAGSKVLLRIMLHVYSSVTE